MAIIRRGALLALVACILAGASGCCTLFTVHEMSMGEWSADLPDETPLPPIVVAARFNVDGTLSCLVATGVTSAALSWQPRDVDPLWRVTAPLVEGRRTTRSHDERPIYASPTSIEDLAGPLLPIVDDLGSGTPEGAAAGPLRVRRTLDGDSILVGRPGREPQRILLARSWRPGRWRVAAMLPLAIVCDALAVPLLGTPILVFVTLFEPATGRVVGSRGLLGC